ncbi:hypothetical protein SSCG_03925 [Streptomyces clavuligerus]|nr:hypothetical protein SSCG_03925 [Streptomyces clavuligerus]
MIVQPLGRLPRRLPGDSPAAPPAPPRPRPDCTPAPPRLYAR